MSSRPLRVLFVASECAPYSKSGGLGDVIGALPRFLRRRGIDARVIVPLHAGYDWRRLDRLDGSLTLETPVGRRAAGIRMSPPEADPPVYLIEHHLYFDRPFLYGPPGGAYGDNLERFVFLCRAAVALCEAIAFLPDVVHASDWQTAVLPALVRTTPGPLRGTPIALTIHNLAFQGQYGADRFSSLGLPSALFDDFELGGGINLLKGAIMEAGAVTTVSPTYAREILTPEQGRGLDPFLRFRGSAFSGILNGLDPEEWSPAHDPHLPFPFHREDLGGKRRCKQALQEEAGLPLRDDVPLFGCVTRLTSQKGIDILTESLPALLDLDLQCVLLGTGDRHLEDRLRELAAQKPDRLRVWIDFDEGLAHRIQGGSDFFLMPSRFEPCGLTQLYALRYGTLPVVHATGGLVDTVENLDEGGERGTGFVAYDLDPRSLYDTVGWAVATWYERPQTIAAMQQRAMSLDFSWDRSAERYEALYRQLLDGARRP